MDIKFYNPDKFAGTAQAHQPADPFRRGFRLPFVPILIVLIICGLLSFWLKFPGFLYPNVIRGDFMDMSLNADGTIWVLTDGSFKYIFTESRPGHYSTGVRGSFCKTYLYHYDPANKKVLKKITARYGQLPGRCYLVKMNDRLWQVSWVSKEPWIINQYNVNTGEQLLDTDKFVAQHPELRPGIAQLYYQPEPDRLSLKSKAGLSFEFLLADDLLLPDEHLLVKEKIVDLYRNQGLASLATLVTESTSGSSRKLLYRIDGSTDNLVNELLWPFNGIDNEFHLYQLSQANVSEKFRATPLTPEEVYLEPIMVYQDSELAVILAQDQIGEEAKRSLYCVNTAGGKRWVAQPDQLFAEIMVRKDNSFTQTNSLKDKIKGERQGNVFILKVQALGAIGFDANTGKKLWAIKL